ncbi:MAG: GNAT family N-acetyltransferase [Rubrivivax sp.]
MPIRSLGPRQRERILAHLLALDEHDRYLRFGYAAGDAHIARYVDQLDFERDEVFGVHGRRLDLLAMAHLAYLGHDLTQPTSAEFGVSVLSRLRGHGIGARLFERACLHARNRAIDTLIVHALTENRAMLAIARHAGATLEQQGADSTAVLRLPPEDLGSHLSELVADQAGELDYGLKVQARRIDRWWHTLLDLVPQR